MDNDGGKGCPTQEMVESYQSKDGKTVDWSKWHGETTELPPYDQLEPRFRCDGSLSRSAGRGIQ